MMNRKPSSEGTLTRIRILVVGDEGVGKNALVEALCGSSDRVGEDFRPAVRVSVRKVSDVVEEYYVLTGSGRYTNARGAVARMGYEGVVFVHADESSRANIRRSWVPWAMYYLGDGKSVTAAGRRGKHVRALGCVNELGVLWRRLRTQYGVSMWAVTGEAIRLVLRWVRLVLHEASIWTDEGVDRVVEHELVAGAEVPVAIVKWVLDEEELDERKARVTAPFVREGKDTFVVDTAINDIVVNKQFEAFRMRCVELVRNGRTPTHRRRRSSTASMALPLLPF